MTTDDVAEVIKAHQAIGEAEQRYRERLRAALAVRGNQARIAEALGVTREKLRQDAMTEEERQAVREADAQRKAGIRERAKSAPTTVYGSWHDLIGDTSLTINQYVEQALGDASAYDVDAIVTAFRAEIAERLPEGVTIHGEGQLYGPHPVRPDWDDVRLELREAIDGIDFWAIAARNERD